MEKTFSKLCCFIQLCRDHNLSSPEGGTCGLVPFTALVLSIPVMAPEVTKPGVLVRNGCLAETPSCC